MLPFILTAAIFMSALPTWALANNHIEHVGKFSAGTLHGWEEKKFDGKTTYELVADIQTKHKVLKASSAGAASGLFREIKIDLKRTPYLNWSWKTDVLLKDIDETSKKGDDFVARVYVVIDGGFFFWKTLALNYVWSSSHQKGEKWDNPYTSNATMYAVESGKENLGTWQTYKRNVRQDLKTLLGKDVQYIDAVAIMTDTDNSGQSATTYFGDIFFTSE